MMGRVVSVSSAVKRAIISVQNLFYSVAIWRYFSYFTSECLFQLAFYLNIALALAIDHSTTALSSQLYSYYKVSDANTL